MRLAEFATFLALMLASCRESSVAGAANSAKPQSIPSEAAPPTPVTYDVPASVAKLHRRTFEANAEEGKLGKALCLVTLHTTSEAPPEEFYAVVLLSDGSVGTWSQRATGAERPFLAKLGADEQKRASELLAAISKDRSLAKTKFADLVVVMGVSTLSGERVETSYFDEKHLPVALSELAGMFKRRLEATNR